MRGAEKLWKMMNELPCAQSLGATTGNQAIQGGRSSTTALQGSTEDEQFFAGAKQARAAA